ncbi:MAG: GTPase [Bdellovibrionota bacterium]
MGLGKASISFTVLDAERVPKGTSPRWAVLGRSNVGKSSLLNALTHPHKFFRTGGKPGVTTGLVAVKVLLGKSELSTLELVDLPGFGYAKHSTNTISKWDQLIESLREKSVDSGIMWIWLADPTRLPAEAEAHLIDWLNNSPFTLVFTKSDQVKPNARAASEKAWASVIKRATEGPFWVSAMKGEGFKDLEKSARSFVRLHAGDAAENASS